MEQLGEFAESQPAAAAGRMGAGGWRPAGTAG